MNPTCIAVALIWHEDQLAVGRRSADVPLAGYDEFPGGKCESRETLESACIREALEETGLRVKVIDTRLQVEHDYAHGKLMLTFFDCALERDESASRLLAPFSWWKVEEVLAGRFPPANGTLLDDLRQHPAPRTMSGQEDS